MSTNTNDLHPARHPFYPWPVKTDEEEEKKCPRCWKCGYIEEDHRSDFKTSGDIILQQFAARSMKL